MSLTNPSAHQPLAARMRPQNLDEFVGQEHILGEGRLLRRAIQADQLSSLIFYGPPGTGKTTLAVIVANTTKAEFIAINAVLAGVNDIRRAIASAQTTRSKHKRKTILFIDEVHRFNKAQQDALLPHVENGTLVLIGATTENPYFEVNKALLSRSRIFQLKQLNEQDLCQLLKNAMRNPETGYGSLDIEIDEDAVHHIVRMSNGDARSVLNALEIAVETTRPQNGKIHIDISVAEQSIQKKALLYDKDGDAHFDTISAFIKSIRGSDPDAALYWLAKMVYAGEDPRFIFRRMIILASEDIGMADPKALGVVMSAAQAFDYVGMPEGQYHLSHACLYLSTAPKSNTAMAYFDALSTVKKGRRGNVPDYLRDASRDGEALGHGRGYLYPHAYRDHWVAQQYLPDFLKNKCFYEPSNQGYEGKIAAQVQRNRELQFAATHLSAHTTETPTSERKADSFWLRRSIEQTSELLKQVRKKIVELTSPQPTQLVLDLSGDSGFLSWMAAAQFPQGGVHACCSSSRNKEKIDAWNKHFDFFSRPITFVNNLETWNPDSIGESDRPFSFDTILGYNIEQIFSDNDGFNDFIIILGEKHLNRTGCVILADILPGHYQSFSKLIEMSFLANGPSTKFPSILDDIKSFEKEFMAKINSGFPAYSTGYLFGSRLAIGHSKTEIIHTRRFISYELIQRWCDSSRPKLRNSFLSYLQDRLSGHHWEEIKTCLSNGLANKIIPWRQAVRFMKIENKP